MSVSIRTGLISILLVIIHFTSSTQHPESYRSFANDESTLSRRARSSGPIKFDKPCWIRWREIIKSGQTQSLSEWEELSYDGNKSLYFVYFDNTRFGTLDSKTQEIRLMGVAELGDAEVYKNYVEVLFIPRGALGWVSKNVSQLPSNGLAIAPPGDLYIETSHPTFICKSGEEGSANVGFSVDQICQTFRHADSSGNVTNATEFFIAINTLESVENGSIPKPIPSCPVSDACSAEVEADVESSLDEYVEALKNISKTVAGGIGHQEALAVIDKILEEGVEFRIIIEEMLVTPPLVELDDHQRNFRLMQLFMEEVDEHESGVKATVAGINRIEEKVNQLGRECGCNWQV